MKLRSSLLHATAALLLAGAAVRPAFAQLPPAETREADNTLVVRGDFDADGDQDIALVDRATGNFHVLTQDGLGSFAKSGPYATGLSDVTGAAAGRVDGGVYDSLVATSATGNRVTAVRAIPAAGTSPVAATLMLPSTLGPSTLALAEAIGSSVTYQDLLLGSEYNAGPNGAKVTVETVGASYAVALASTKLTTTGRMTDGTRTLVKSTLGDTVSLVSRTGTSASFRIYGLGLAGFPTVFSLTAQPVDAEYAVAPFGAALATVFRWIPGGTTLAFYSLNEPSANNFGVATIASTTLSSPIRSVTVVPATAAQNHLLITFGDGSLVQTYSFTAPSTLTLLGTHTLAAGEGAFGAIGVPGNNGFQLFTGDLATGLISRTRVHRWNGTGFAETQVIEGLGFKELSALTNVFVFTADPFVTPGSTLLSRLTARDWTSGVPPVPPGNIVVQAETFNGVSSGLGGASAINLGAFPAGAGYTLLSQYRNNISVFGLSKPGGRDSGDVSITPAAGTFNRTVLVDFSAPAGYSIYYRFSNSASWTLFVDPGAQPSEQSDPAYATWLANALPLMLFRTTTVQYFAESASARTPIHSATYTFPHPETMSSLDDGVPDYVKIGRGNNPFLQPPNGDVPGDVTESGDPQSYLQKLLFDAGYTIPNRNTTPGAYTLYVRPQSSDGVASFTAGSLVAGSPATLADGTANTGSTLTAYGFSGGALDSSDVTSHPTVFAQASAEFIHLTSDPASPLFVCGTIANFPIDAAAPTPPISSVIGRELASVQIAPDVPASVYTRTLGSGSTAAEAAAWLAGAAAYYGALTPPSHSATLDVYDTGVALVFENWLQRRLAARGVLPSVYDPSSVGYASTNRLSITPYRSSEGAVPLPTPATGTTGVVSVGFTEVSGLSEYVSLADTGHDISGVVTLLDTQLRTSVDTDIVALRRVVEDVYRISAAYGNTYPGAFDAPIDALRTFILTGVMPTAYTQANPQLTPAGWNILPATFTSLTASDYTAATQGVSDLRALITARPVADFDLVVRADTVSESCTILDRYSMGGTYALFRSDGTRFRFPDNFDVIPGVRITVRAYTDATFATCTGTPLEVLAIDGVPVTTVTVIPAASATDTDGNLLGDEWELAFFGSLGNDPWAKPAGDGYTTLQKYLDSADPFLFASYGALPAAALVIPDVAIGAGSVGTATLSFSYPSTYFGKLRFRVQTNTSLSAPAGWTDVTSTFGLGGSGRYEATVPYTGGTQFWRVLVSLP